MERDDDDIAYWEEKLNFNSHAHVERDFEFFDNEMYIPNFNSHAHVERDKDQNGNYVINDISTHTLTWSVTITY